MLQIFLIILPSTITQGYESRFSSMHIRLNVFIAIHKELKSKDLVFRILYYEYIPLKLNILILLYSCFFSFCLYLLIVFPYCKMISKLYLALPLCPSLIPRSSSLLSSSLSTTIIGSILIYCLSWMTS